VRGVVDSRPRIADVVGSKLVGSIDCECKRDAEQ
jgi:hypothetical protein